MIRARIARAIALVVIGASGSLQAQEPLTIPRLAGPVVLDGMSYEAAWEAVAPLPLTVHYPTLGAAPSERTEIRVAHDGEYLYAVGRMYDAEPAGIRATSLRRDDGSFSNDWFVLTLDTFNDKETTLLFATNPAGIRTDAVLTDDAGRGPDVSWNAFWDAAVRWTDEGWFAEIRIPFSSLRFQERDGRVVMGLAAWRRIARKSELILFPAIPPRWGRFSMYKASQFQEVALEGVRRRNLVRATPYLLAGAGRDHSLNAQGTAYVPGRERVRETGLDVKYAFTSNLTLDLTYNTDFAQVEADEQQVNLTRFRLSYPEKRQFFLERAGAYDFPTGGNDRLFYSRRVGLVDGRPVPLLGGARLVGRVGRWDLGAMSLQTGGLDDLPAENFGVTRLRRQVRNENSYLGGILTTRVGGRGSAAYGVDALLRVRGQDYLTLALAQSREHEPAAAGQGWDRALARARWERRSGEGLGYALDASRIGAAFEPPAGFLLRRGHLRLGDRISYGWRAGETSFALRHTLALAGAAYRRLEDGVLESAAWGPEWVLEAKSGDGVVVRAQRSREVLAGGFRLSGDVHVPPGAHDFTRVQLAYGGSTRRVLRADLFLDGGSFYDGRSARARITSTWNQSRHLELSGLYEQGRIEFSDRGQRLTEHAARLRVQAMLTTRLFAASFVQYNSVLDRAFLNVRIRFNPQEGEDLYVVYNAGLNTAAAAAGPAPPRLDDRVLLVKYSRAFALGL